MTVLRIRKRGYSAADTLIDLLPYRILDSWNHSTPIDGRITEVFRIAIEGTDRDDVRTKVNALESVLRAVEKWHNDPAQYEEVWLEVGVTGEPFWRRTLIFEAFMVHVSNNDHFGAQMLNGPAVLYDLTITRHQYYESDKPETHTASIQLNDYGGFYDLSSELSGGQVPARINTFNFSLAGGTFTTNFTKAWFGLRPKRYPTAVAPTKFSFSYTDMTALVDASSNAGLSSIDVDFATTPALAFRTYIRPASMASYVGSYTILMEGKTTGSEDTVVALRASASMASPTVARITQPTPIQYIGDTIGFRVYELGSINLPSVPFRKDLVDQINEMDAPYINIEAQLIEGTPGSDGLLIKRIILVPTEFFILWENGTVYSRVDVNDESQIGSIITPPDDSYHGVILDPDNPPFSPRHIRDAIVSSDNNWFYPEEGAYLVGVAVAHTDGLQSEIIDVDMVITKRWLSYRDD